MPTSTSERTQRYAVGLRKRLQKDAMRAGFLIRLPRYALVEHVGSLLADVENLPVQHGLKPRTVCTSCLKVKPATLHWTAEALRGGGGAIAVMCRTCAAGRLGQAVRLRVAGVSV